MQIAEIREKPARPSSPGFRFAVVSGTPADHASWWSFDDEQELRDRWWLPAAGDLVLDVGAAFGSYTLPALARGARVVAFSPADFDTELLQLNLAQNPALQRRCMVVRDGLYSRDGYFNPDRCEFRDEALQTGLLRGPGENRGWNAIADKIDGQWLRVRSLDSFLAERPGVERVDWMKLDVEGAELEVLRGAEQCLLMYRPRILVENHEFQCKGIAGKVRDYLLGLGVGYTCDGPHQHCAVSHSFYEVR